jgi:hypothetical protein
VQLELINQPGGQILLDGAGASSQQHIPATSGLLGLLECGPDPLGDEDEGGPSLHLQGLAGMVGEHEDRRVERRVVAPPAVPRGSSRQGPGPPPNMLRPITVAPTFACASSTTAVLALASPPSRPCCLRHASSLKTHWCSSMPPTPSGFSSLWSGPATNPVQRHRQLEPERAHRPSRLPWLTGRPLRLGNLDNPSTTLGTSAQSSSGTSPSLKSHDAEILSDQPKRSDTTL